MGWCWLPAKPRCPVGHGCRRRSYSGKRHQAAAARPRRKMPSDAWTEQETQLLKRAVRAVPSDLEKNDRWRQVAVLVGGGRGKKECYEYWKAINKAKAAPVL